jgi:hypothetical protein
MDKREGPSRRAVEAIKASERQAERDYYDFLVSQGRQKDADAIFPEGRP